MGGRSARVGIDHFVKHRRIVFHASKPTPHGCAERLVDTVETKGPLHCLSVQYLLSFRGFCPTLREFCNPITEDHHAVIENTTAVVGSLNFRLVNHVLCYLHHHNGEDEGALWLPEGKYNLPRHAGDILPLLEVRFKHLPFCAKEIIQHRIDVVFERMRTGDPVTTLALRLNIMGRLMFQAVGCFHPLACRREAAPTDDNLCHL